MINPSGMKIPTREENVSEFRKANAHTLAAIERHMRGEPDTEPELSDDQQLAAQHARELIPLEHLAACPFQPRKHFDQAKLIALAASLTAAGRNNTDLRDSSARDRAGELAFDGGAVNADRRRDCGGGHAGLAAGEQQNLPRCQVDAVEFQEFDERHRLHAVANPQAVRV